MGFFETNLTAEAGGEWAKRGFSDFLGGNETSKEELKVGIKLSQV